MATPSAKAATRKCMATPSGKAATHKRTATPSAKAATRKRMATPSAKAATRKRKATPSAKAATRKRKATPSAKAATRKRKATPTALEADAKRKAERRATVRGAERQRMLQGRAQRQEEALACEGTWAITAQQVSAAQGSPSPFSKLPPAFAALHTERCLAFVREMCEALELVQWQTCVVCWKQSMVHFPQQ